MYGTIPNSYWNKRVPVKAGEKVGENQNKILGLIKNNSFITIPELSQQVKISKTAIYNNISKLKAKGLLERIDPDKGGYQMTGTAEVYRKADVVA